MTATLSHATGVARRPKPGPTTAFRSPAHVKSPNVHNRRSLFLRLKTAAEKYF